MQLSAPAAAVLAPMSEVGTAAHRQALTRASNASGAPRSGSKEGPGRTTPAVRPEAGPDWRAGALWLVVISRLTRGGGPDS
jgi:hypothetical protein